MVFHRDLPSTTSSLLGSPSHTRRSGRRFWSNRQIYRSRRVLGFWVRTRVRTQNLRIIWGAHNGTYTNVYLGAGNARVPLHSIARTSFCAHALNLPARDLRGRDGGVRTAPAETQLGFTVHSQDSFSQADAESHEGPVSTGGRAGSTWSGAKMSALSGTSPLHGPSCTPPAASHM